MRWVGLGGLGGGRGPLVLWLIVQIPPCRGVKHRYVWANVASRPTNMGNAIGKFDVETGEVKVWHEAGALPGATLTGFIRRKKEKLVCLNEGRTLALPRSLINTAGSDPGVIDALINTDALIPPGNTLMSPSPFPQVSPSSCPPLRPAPMPVRMRGSS